MERKLSIYSAEITTGENDVGKKSFHSCTYLVDVTNPVKTVVQELHFKDDGVCKMLPVAREASYTLRDKHRELKLKPYIAGSEADILPRWNHALAQAVHVRENVDIKFEPGYDTLLYATNCRTGTQAMAHSMGLSYSDEFAASAVGLKSMAIPVGKVFSFDDVEEKNVDKLWEDNAALIQKLPDIPAVRTLTPEEIRSLEFF